MTERTAPLLRGADPNTDDEAEYDLPVASSSRLPTILKFLAAALVTVACVLLGVYYTHPSHPRGHGASHNGKRNLILMVSDGMGPATVNLARTFWQQKNGHGYGVQLPLDKAFVGTSRTRSSDSWVTDSAAGATAFSCGLKTYNGAIGVDPHQRPCGTVLEAAHRKGYKTGLVVTSRITHATPGSFNAHVVHRDMENLIAEHQVGLTPLGRTADLMFGGGRCHFLPAGMEGSCRTDTKNLLDIAASNGFAHIQSRAEFDALNKGQNATLPLLGLFADDHMDYDVDRDEKVQPSLAEMAATALEALKAATEDQDEGFFLMIEGSRIDMAQHNNDPVGAVNDAIMYNHAFKVVQDFIDENPGTVVVSTSDHETGGLSVARQIHDTYPDYLWYPGVLLNATRSTEGLGMELADYDGKESNLQSWVKETIIGRGLGIWDATDDEIALLLDGKKWKIWLWGSYILSDMISRRAQVGWATHGHSAVDVNIYAYGDEAIDVLRGNHENTEVGDFIATYLGGLNLDEVTLVLNENNGTMTKPVGLAEAEALGATSKGFTDTELGRKSDHYHHDFKRRDLEFDCGCH
ncbi:alkaline phosphatase-like protein [Saitoella complicata NRRL Y-17804]|uniref:alkaline phosphatase-like protein n=1 Tax=Saitoella complicata (strain BCRC 22490 / CBS 7301 / JCM 7358 / NBRC 10748 / NRRL Y-17804) TaxID=698492 RepID=UPI000867125E|nr:alkaline phosphatase-like protein [Saitoella complicata NRRL Y-17804]ODQ50251.1 alkaline phosphatase-like protein [Saitoella complicata NRRL Y-17804]